MEQAAGLEDEVPGLLATLPGADARTLDRLRDYLQAFFDEARNRREILEKFADDCLD